MIESSHEEIMDKSLRHKASILKEIENQQKEDEDN